jgi:SAM-dependent methyltransferase
MPEAAINRLLDIEELSRPSFRHIIVKMEDLLRRYEGLHLHPSKRWEYPWSLRRARIAAGAQVLDAGCGASIFPVYLSTLRVQVTAIDRFLPKMQHARFYHPHLKYIRGKIQDLPFADHAFDAVFCISVIEHLPIQDMMPALKEMARVLKPGGRLLLTTDYTENAGESLRYEGPGENFSVDWNVFDWPQLQNLLDAFTELEMEGKLNLRADWPRIRNQMRRFHGYPYTAVGIAFRKHPHSNAP